MGDHENSAKRDLDAIVDYINKQLANLTGIPEQDAPSDVHVPIKDRGMDSIKFIHLIVLIEQRFDVVYEDGQLSFDASLTADSLAKSVVGKMAGKEREREEGFR